MKLSKHIAYKLLSDYDLPAHIIMAHFPKEFSEYVTCVKNKQPISDKKMEYKIATLFDILCYNESKNYYITETVIEKLDMLKVKKKVVGGFSCYDYTVFGKIKPVKLTFIMPDNVCLRIYIEEEYLCFAWFTLSPFGKEEQGTKVKTMYGIETTLGNLMWTFFYVNRFTGGVSNHHGSEMVQSIETTIYKLLCFFYLSENEEIVVPPKGSHGTKKHGKILNELPFPVTIVTSKWNVTSVRTEGFDVMGHFRLQRKGKEWSETEMIFIEPFKKHGYVRHAAKDSSVNK